MPTATPPPTARRNYAVSAYIAQRAAREALKARPRGSQAILSVVGQHQVAQAQTSALAVAQMLVEQDIEAEAEALLNLIGFTTPPDSLAGMIDAVDTDAEFERMVASIVQDAARAAESVAVTVRPHIYHVRFVNLPCCPRCAVLAGRVYRWSSGFERHPNCSCSMIPTTVASPLRQDPDELVRSGQVRGLSKYDMQALADGADLSRVVNVRSRKAGLLEAGHALTRAGKPTPASIYRQAGDDRAKALELLTAAGYIR